MNNMNAYVFIALVLMVSSVPILKAYRPVTRPSKTVSHFKGFDFTLNSMGSDQIARPDDEDSPEFKEYLKALLKMQATRAKSGKCKWKYLSINLFKLQSLPRFHPLSLLNFFLVLSYFSRICLSLIGIFGCLRCEAESPKDGEEC